MVSTKSALEANYSQQDLLVSRSKLGKVFCSEDPRHTPVEQGLNHLGLQDSDLQAKGVVVLSYNSGPDRFETCSHETDPSFEFEREANIFLDNAV